MASVVSPYHPYPTPTVSRNSTISIGGSSSQESINHLEHFHPSPIQTPPPSRGYPSSMSFQMTGFAGANGIPMQVGHGPYQSINGAAQQQYSSGHRPQIYTAVYSGVPVYEMEINSIALMRRRSDSWLNATQILKVAGVDKGKRTKVLEKEILSGEHEKVQGGYGKYQGTWINYKRGREFCRQYGVEDLLLPLLEYDMGQDGITQAGQGSVETPTKEQAMAANRKRMMFNGNMDNRPPANSPNGTFFSKISSAAANAVQAINKSRFDSPAPKSGRPKLGRTHSQRMSSSQESQYQPSSQQSMPSLHSETSFGAHGLDAAFGSQGGQSSSNKRPHSSAEMHDSPRKKIRPASSQDHFTNGFDAAMSEATERYEYRQPDDTVLAVKPLPQPSNALTLEKQQLMVSLFVDTKRTDFTNEPILKQLEPEDLDIPMDTTAHAALHWAASLGKISLLRELIAHGANIYRVNGGGETALIRAVVTTNNFDASTFPELLELLGPTIEMRDYRGRTVLHHIAVSAGITGRKTAARYYLESLLEFVVRQGSGNHQVHARGGTEPATKPRLINLARFMAELVNAQDLAGDTALNLTARTGQKSIIQQLLEVGANPSIPNRGNLKPIDFGVGGEPDPESTVLAESKTTLHRVAETGRSLITSFSTLISDAETSIRAELYAKQSLIDQSNARLREITAQLNDERRRLADLQKRAATRRSMTQQLANLRRANATERRVLVEKTGNATHVRDDVSIGEADTAFEINGARLSNVDLSSPSLRAQAYAASLPEPSLLRARVRAYRGHNERLAARTRGLLGRSAEAEGNLRRLVALCTEEAEAGVDALVGRLVVAVESEVEAEVEVGRVREFLRRVKEAEGVVG